MIPAVNFDNDINAVKTVLASQNAAHAASMAARQAAAQQGTPGAGLAAAVGRRVGGTQALPNAVNGSYSGGTPLPNAHGNVGQWISKALGVLHLDGSYAGGINNLIQHESGGNPNAINNWDSNAKAGHPSKGLMQTIDGTFASNALPGYNKNVYDPVSNIIAGIRYARARYGDGMLKSGGRKNSSGKYIGY